MSYQRGQIQGTGPRFIRSKSLELARCLFEESNDALFVFDFDDLRVMAVNPSALKLTRFSRRNLLKTRLSELLLSDAPDFLTDLFDASRNTRRFQPRESCTLVGDGVRFEVNVKVSRLHDKPNRLGLLVAHDVSGRRAMEGELRKTQDLLASALQHSDLVHQSRLSTLGEISAGIVHELNQPLSAISNYADAALQVLGDSEDSFDNPVASWIRQAGRQAVRCGEIIRRLRRFSTLEEAERRSVDVRSVLRDSVSLLGGVFREHNVVVNTQLPERELCVVGNDTQLQQVFVNLLCNACNAMTEAGVEQPQICIHASVDQCLDVTVSDNGPGVASQVVEKMFEPFFTTRRDGMGMGLAISRSIIENHQGRLWLHTESSIGACFHVELPIEERR